MNPPRANVNPPGRFVNPRANVNPQGSAVIVGDMGRRARVSAADVLEAVAKGGPEFVRAELARRLGVAESSVRRAVKRTAAAQPHEWAAAVEAWRERLRSRAPGPRPRVRGAGRRPARVEVQAAKSGGSTGAKANGAANVPATVNEAAPVPAADVRASSDVPPRLPAAAWAAALREQLPATAEPCGLSLDFLASALEDWALVSERAEVHGPVVRDEQGRTILNHWWLEKVARRKEVWDMLKECGLTPASLLRLQARAQEGRAAGTAADLGRQRLEDEDGGKVRDWFQGPVASVESDGG